MAIAVGCAHGYHLGNPDWVAMWSNWPPEQRADFLARAQELGLVSSNFVDVNSSVAPEMFWATGPCAGAYRVADRDLEAQRGQAYSQLPDPIIQGDNRAGLLPLPGLGWFGDPDKRLAIFGLLAALLLGLGLAMMMKGRSKALRAARG